MRYNINQLIVRVRALIKKIDDIIYIEDIICITVILCGVLGIILMFWIFMISPILSIFLGAFLAASVLYLS